MGEFRDYKSFHGGFVAQGVRCVCLWRWDRLKSGVGTLEVEPRLNLGLLDRSIMVCSPTASVTSHALLVRIERSFDSQSHARLNSGPDMPLAEDVAKRTFMFKRVVVYSTNTVLLGGLRLLHD
jgi:hypothetical protein